jgi:hypothetical protein
MIRKNYRKIKVQIESRRFKLLLLATSLVLILPAFSGRGLLSLIIFVVSISFLLVQSAIISSTYSKRSTWSSYIIMFVILVLYWLEPAGYTAYWVSISKFLLLALSFVFVTVYLLRFLRKSKTVNIDVIIVAINIYLLFGIIAGSLTFIFYLVNPDSYNLPSYINQPSFLTFAYYSFITMSTVGYGDITPKIVETQTLAYFIAITGQLYVAIIIAFLVGKLLVNADQDK